MRSAASVAVGKGTVERDLFEPVSESLDLFDRMHRADPVSHRKNFG
jgi:hypothetical protein